MKSRKYLLTVMAAMTLLWACGTATEQETVVSGDTKTGNLFSSKCSMCHAFKEDKIGPALDGVHQRWGNDRERLKGFIRNAQAVIKSGDPYANDLYKKWNQSEMPSFPDLSEEELDALVDYLK